MATKKRDLIDRDRLLRDTYFREGRYPESHLLRMAIGEQPAVDAVEVVRCKDCKHWKYDARKLCGRCDALMCYRPDYFWCMYGERRTDNG